MIFYVLDLGIHGKEDWSLENLALVDARWEGDAAETWAARLEDQHDGMEAECLVSETEDVADATHYVVRISVEWSYDVSEKMRRA